MQQYLIVIVKAIYVMGKIIIKNYWIVKQLGQ